jgi:hypothetical protein
MRNRVIAVSVVLLALSAARCLAAHAVVQDGRRALVLLIADNGDGTADWRLVRLDGTLDYIGFNAPYGGNAWSVGLVDQGPVWNGNTGQWEWGRLTVVMRNNRAVGQFRGQWITTGITGPVNWL